MKTTHGWTAVPTCAMKAWRPGSTLELVSDSWYRNEPCAMASSQYEQSILSNCKGKQCYCVIPHSLKLLTTHTSE